MHKSSAEENFSFPFLHSLRPKGSIVRKGAKVSSGRQRGGKFVSLRERYSGNVLLLHSRVVALLPVRVVAVRAGMRVKSPLSNLRNPSASASERASERAHSFSHPVERKTHGRKQVAMAESSLKSGFSHENESFSLLLGRSFRVPSPRQEI